MPWYYWFPTIDIPLWPCAVLLVIFAPVSVWHERNWRKTLAEYAAYRREAGAPDTAWPPVGLRARMSVQPGLVAIVAATLAVMTGIALWGLLVWPHRPLGWDMPVNYFDLPYLWTMVVASIAAVVGAFALAVDLWRSPWVKVAARIRRSMYRPAEVKAAMFAAALEIDPEMQPRAQSGL